MSQQVFRVLIVEDDREKWAQQMADHLHESAQAANPVVKTIIACDALVAEHQMLQGHFHLVSLDMLIPGRTGEVKVVSGVDLARLAFKSGALVSKLIVYSGMLSGGDPIVSEEIHADLPKLDRYAKADTSEPDLLAPTERLTQGQWALRVLDYLNSDQLTLKITGRPRAQPKTAIGNWLENAPKHLPILLARHAQTLSNTWEDPASTATRFDAALRFIEVTTRLALLQTQVLLNTSGVARRLLPPPGDARVIGCLEQLKRHVGEHATPLAQWSWFAYLKPALPALDEARLQRNAERHALSPNIGKGTWAKLRPQLQAAMDLSAYWALHPIWTELRFGTDGWSGERLAGNSWPRQRRKVELDVPFTGEEVRGGAWQSAVRVSGPEPLVQRVDWSGWLEADGDRAWRFLAHTEPRGGRIQQQWLDLDSGDFLGRFAK